MDKFVINGGAKLSGTLTMESAKNSVLPMLAACVMSDGRVEIENCPAISDVKNMVRILKTLGVEASFEGKTLVVNAKGFSSYTVGEELTKELRSSIIFLGALLGKTRKVQISYPGGCDLGGRPIDIHIDALRKMGATITEGDCKLICSAENLVGAEVVLPFPSVGATENIMLAATLADGITIIKNPAREPEIVDLMKFLNVLGGKVWGAGGSEIIIEGVKTLHGGRYKPVSDRIETGTYLLAAAVTGGEIELKNANGENISSLIGKLCDNTCSISIKNDIIFLKSGTKKKAFGISTAPYPLFPTDLQPQTTVLLALSDGVSVVEENIFQSRYSHVEELKKMGARITVRGKTAIVEGVNKLHGAEVFSHDLRCGAALVIAGLAAEGKTIVKELKYIERGYLNMDKKLRELGADVRAK